MDAPRFDTLARVLATTGTRRAFGFLATTIPGLLAVQAVAPFEAEARKKRRKRKQASTEGPCGNGGGKANRCKRNRQCCTGYCKKRKRKRKKNGKRRKVQGRCRCRKAGQACNDERNCCPERTGRICKAGTCQVPACADLCPDGCCAGEECKTEQSPEFCGIGGATCETCSGDTPVCWQGDCVCGDVCESGCRYSSIQDAIDDPQGPEIIRLCAETYGETITIGRSLTLFGNGQGEDGTILDGQDSGTVVTIASGVTAELEALRITGGEGNSGGQADGGGIFNSGTLTLTDTTVTGNNAGDDAGGIYNDEGTVTLNTSTVSHNVCGQDGGGFFNVQGIVNLNDSSVTSNEANFGGGLANVVPGVINLTNSHVTLNEAGGAGQGGGIYNNGTINADGASTIVDNIPDDCINIGGGSGCP